MRRRFIKCAEFGRRLGYIYPKDQWLTAKATQVTTQKWRVNAVQVSELRSVSLR